MSSHDTEPLRELPEVLRCLVAVRASISPLGLRGDALVCDESGSPGDAPSRCGSCRREVRVPREHIRLFGGSGDPPEVRCVDCHAMKDEMTWFPIKASEAWTVQVDFADFATDALEDMKRAIGQFAAPRGWEPQEPLARVERCRSCGATTKGGAKFCPGCVRRQRRRGR